jgi:DNA-binding NarL/FixJ family response regulator
VVEEDWVRVVIADDNDAVRELLRLVVELDDRLRVVGEAADGREALTVVADERPDVLLLDLAMPVLDGLEVLARLQDDDADVKVVVYSGFAGEDLKAAAIAAGADDYLVKGVDPTLIVERLVAVAR